MRNSGVVPYSEETVEEETHIEILEMLMEHLWHRQGSHPARGQAKMKVYGQVEP